METSTPIILSNPATGMILRVMELPRDRAVDPLVLEATYPARSAVPPDHLHPRQREDFQVIKGEMRVRIRGVERTCTTGDVFDIPAGTRHAMWNASATPTTLRWHIQPALRTLELFTKLCELAAQGRTNAAGVPGLLQSAVLASVYRNELRTTRPSPAVQRVAIAVLAPIGRMLGLRG
jgi:hypothetical protein